MKHTVMNLNHIQEGIKSRLNYGNTTYILLKSRSSFRLLSKILEIKHYQISPAVLYGCRTYSAAVTELKIL